MGLWKGVGIETLESTFDGPMHGNKVFKILFRFRNLLPIHYTYTTIKNNGIYNVFCITQLHVVMYITEVSYSARLSSLYPWFRQLLPNTYRLK